MSQKDLFQLAGSNFRLGVIHHHAVTGIDVDLIEVGLPIDGAIGIGLVRPRTTSILLYPVLSGYRIVHEYLLAHPIVASKLPGLRPAMELAGTVWICQSHAAGDHSPLRLPRL